MPRPRNSGRRPLVGADRKQNPPATGAVKTPDVPLPHERDQSTQMKEHPSANVIEQAKDDVDAGLQETDLRGRAGEVFDRRWTGRRRKT